uniref:Nucleotide-diphospho-sugar transferase domain-containing protein n=1 Tax=Parascaris equorum TaxID=6256 RepID=A0A914RGW3_PAREQ
MRDVHNRTLFFTLDEVARRGLIEFYPTLRIFRWNETFKTADVTYMSFFLLRTNLIRALLRMERTFWMLQADTIWRGDLYRNDVSGHTIRRISQPFALVDQNGKGESRKRQMNGANFFIKYSPQTVKLFDELYWYQSRLYVTDPDAIKIMCNEKDRYQCDFIEHRLDKQESMLMCLDRQKTTGGRRQGCETYRTLTISLPEKIMFHERVNSRLHP